jgi:drug/metabolite transporter (DMT)-like permease
VTVTTAAETYDRPLKAIYYLIAGVFVFSIQDVIIKKISGLYPVHEIVFIRSCFAVIPILLIAHFEGGLNLLKTKHLTGHITRSLLMFSAYSCFYLSLATLPLAESVSLFFSCPILITILSVISLNEKVEFKNWIAVLVGFLGIIIMLKPGSNMIDPAAFLALLTALLYAIASIITRRLGRTENGVSLAFYPTVMYMIYSAILGIALNSIVDAQIAHPSLAFLFRAWQLPSQVDLFIFILLGLIAASGFYFLSQAYRLAQPSTIAPFEYIAVPVSVLWGYLFFDDILGYQSVIGMVLIVGSGLYIFGSKKGFTNKYVLSLFKIKIRR